MKYSLSPTAWSRVITAVDLGLRELRRADNDSPKELLRVWFTALTTEECYRPTSTEWLERLFVFARQSDNQSYRNLALDLAASITWEWQDARRVALTARDALRLVANYSPASEVQS